jgi:NADH dehydrogenase FAD-containing subunit
VQELASSKVDAAVFTAQLAAVSAVVRTAFEQLRRRDRRVVEEALQTVGRQQAKDTPKSWA